MKSFHAIATSSCQVKAAVSSFLWGIYREACEVSGIAPFPFLNRIAQNRKEFSVLVWEPAIMDSGKKYLIFPCSSDTQNNLLSMAECHGVDVSTVMNSMLIIAITKIKEEIEPLLE